MTPLYIFDLDGTLANIDHRTPILDRTDLQEDQRWRLFFSKCDKDTPNADTIVTLNQLLSAGSEVWVFSGRSEEVRSQSMGWLYAHTDLPARVLNDPLRFRMRKVGDQRPDDQVKAEWLAEMPRADRSRLVAVFDDRNSVVAMWRAAGVPCFQVREGDF